MEFDPNRITFFAKTDARGQNIPFGIRGIDRQRHMYVIGKTGMGKSTMLENMAVQDMQNGEGMAFIDPHGATAETLLDYVPENRIDDVIYFAPFDTDHPIAFNVMEDVGEDKRHLVVSGLMSTFKKIWVDAWSARMEYILTNTLLALLEYPDSTLLSVNRMLSDKAYRKKVVAYVKDPAVKSFWVDEFANYTDRFAAEATPAIQNKVGQFTGNPLIRNIIGQPKSSFDIRDIMDEKKILIMNLSKGLVGETNANLLGSMLTTRIYLAAMSRADLSPQEMQGMPNFYFYVDEFQSFANTTFSNILSEARKYKLNLTIAHQYIEQMEEEVRDAVFGNVGTTISFRVGPFDAETLETVFTPKFLAADLVNLGFAQIYLTLMIDGVGSQPFSAVTLPPIEPPQTSYKNMVIARSREQFGGARSEVETHILKLNEPEPPPKKVSNGKADTGPMQSKNGGAGGNTETRDAVEKEVPKEKHISWSERQAQKAVREKPKIKEEKKDVDRSKSISQKESVERSDGDETNGTLKNNSKENHDHKPKSNGKPSGKNLEELRAVLKEMTPLNAVSTNEKSNKEEKPEEKPKDGLKDAISDVLKTEQAAVTAVSEKNERPEESKQNEERPQNVSQNEKEISPKELERMMRVTTSDKSPLR